MSSFPRSYDARRPDDAELQLQQAQRRQCPQRSDITALLTDTSRQTDRCIDFPLTAVSEIAVCACARACGVR